MNICPHCGGNQFIDREGSIVCAFCSTQVGQREVVTVGSEGNEGSVEVATTLLTEISFLVSVLIIIASFWNDKLVPLQAVVLCVALLIRIIRLCLSRADSAYHTLMFFSQASMLLFTYIRLLQLH